jgi:hypothetical protein
VFVDELIRIRLPQVRARFRPAEFEQLRAVRIAIADHACAVQIVSTESAGCFGARRRWMICPRCSRRTTVISFDALSAWFGCRGCLRYRWRRASVPAPHTRCRLRVDEEHSEEVHRDVP